MGDLRISLFKRFRNSMGSSHDSLMASLRNAFEKIKEEMTDHLHSINENTAEINSTQGYIATLEKKIEKLNEKIIDLELRLNEATGKKKQESNEFAKIRLTNKEKEVFMLLYSRSGDLLDYAEISKNLGIGADEVKKHLSTMIGKGIPIIKKYFNNQMYHVLDPDFSDLQAKENIINVHI